jgi:hypothetical protein
MKSLGPVAMCVNTVEACLPMSTGSQAALREWEVGALTPILWYTTPLVSTAHTLIVPQLTDAKTASPTIVNIFINPTQIKTASTTSRGPWATSLTWVTLDYIEIHV